MLAINARNDYIYFKDIKPDFLPQLLNWYNRVSEFKFATGIDAPITIETLTEKYVEAAICSNEFFTSIHLCKDNTLIGILKGSIGYNEKKAVWISSIIIDTEFQNKGFGTKTILLLFDFFTVNFGINSAYLAVIEKNIQGMAFWTKLLFKKVRRYNGHFMMEYNNQNVSIMYRRL